jgi:cell wall-associated NlpC family hydrolase
MGAGGGSVVTSRSSPMLTAAVSGSGQAASAAGSASNVVGGQVSALGEQDLVSGSDLGGALAAAGAGRGQMDSVISGALADITSLAASTLTPAGQQALVSALAARLEQTWQALTNGNADSSTRAASSTQVAAAYSGLGNYPVGGLASTVPMSYAGAASSMAAMSPVQSASTLSSQTMAANQAMIASATEMASMQQASTAQQKSTSSSDVQHATLASATKSQTTAHINTVISRAMGERGVPYSYGGGTPNGPSVGPGTNTKGFDCSSLVQYAYWPYVHLPRTTYEQIDMGTTVSRSNIQPGDLIFSYFGEGGVSGPGHVQMAIGHGANSQVIEAPYTGQVVRVTGIAPGTVVVKRILGGGGGSIA